MLPSNNERIVDRPDEGGLHAPKELGILARAWWWFDFVVLVNLARLRFVAILIALGFVVTQWDTLVAYYEKWTRPDKVSSVANSRTEYFCPMHPSVVRDNAKEKCPICFMPLSKRVKGEAGNEEALPAGVVNRVQLSPYRMILAGVQTSEVMPIQLTKEITAVGFVEFNERGMRNVSARAKGRLDELLVNETGQMVSEGDVLASLYSPDLNVTVQNLLDAKRRNSTEMVSSSRQRLNLLGISDDQIDSIIQTGVANSHLRIRSPISGHVIRKYVREGQYVDEGSPLYDIADLSSIWIQAQVYEDDMVFLPTEQSHMPNMEEAVPLSVTATTRAFPGEHFQGQLAFVYPHVDQQSRTVTVRFELKNPGHKLRPGMTASISIQVPLNQVSSLREAAAKIPDGESELADGKILAIPESAVIETGRQTIVYREVSQGVFEGVLVTVGPKLSGTNQSTYFPITSGLKSGDKIVNSGAFLIDAETRLNPAAGSIYFGGSGSGTKSGNGVVQARPSTPKNEADSIRAAIESLSKVDQSLVKKQRTCPIIDDSQLGSMGVPIKLMLDGKPVFVCCEGCVKSASEHPQETLIKINRLLGPGSEKMEIQP